MPKSKFGKELSKYKKSWKGSKKQFDEQFGGVKLDEGEYHAKLRAAKLTTTKGGNLCILREFVITKGAGKNSVVRDRLWFHTEMGPVFIRRFIDLAGYDCPDDVEDMEETLGAITKDASDGKIRLSHSGDFTNIRVLQLGDAEDEDDSDEDDSDSEDEDEDEDEEDGDEDEDEEEADDDSDSEEEDEDDEEEEEEEGEDEEDEDEDDEEGDDEEEEEDDDDLKERAATFCATWGLDADDDASVDDLKELIDTGGYKEEELDKEEIQILSDLGLADSCIKKAKKDKKSSKAGKGKKSKKGKK